MVATTLRIGGIALIGYNGGSSDGSGRPATTDKFHFVLLTAIGSGTNIFFTDKTWNGTAFSTSGTDGTFTFTAATDMAAGTVITITAAQLLAAGIDFEHIVGEAIYVYQGAVDAPTQFLFAIEGGDGNTTFAGSLANTGLSVGNGAISVPFDSGSYAGPTTFAGSFLHNGGATLFQSLSQSDNWYGDDQDGLNAVEAQVQTGPWLVAPDVEMFGAAAGGGHAIVRTGHDATVGGGTADFNHAELYNGLLSGGITVFWNPRDMVFDTVEGKFFVIDSDIGGGHNRILQGNIADLLGNPGTMPTLITLFSDTGTTAANVRLDNFEVDIVNNIIYFTHGGNLEKVVFDTPNQTSTVLFRANVTSGTSPSGVANPAGSGSNGFNDMVINFTTGSIYLSSTRVVVSGGGDTISKNFIYELTGLTTASGNNAFQFQTGNIGTARLLPFAQNDVAYNPNAGTTFFGSTAANQAFFLAQEYGSLDGLAINPLTNTLYFSTGAILFDHDGDADPADTIYQTGIIGSYALAGNPTGAITVLHTQPGGAGTGLYGDLEVDVAGGRLYVTDYNGTNASNEDSHIFSIPLAGGTRTQYSNEIGNIEGLSTVGFAINHAPTVTGTGVTSGGTNVTETAGASSVETAGVVLYSGITVDDIDTGSGNEITGAVVRISVNFQSGATHQDFLKINSSLSGSIAGTSITYAYNQTTGAMILTGQGTVAQYKAAIELVTFSMSGDNPTDFGTALTRSFAVAVTDGLSVSDEVVASVTVVGVNDNPINTVGGTLTLNEDATATALTGISIADADASVSSALMTVQLSVGRGIITLNTGVAGGVTAGQITAGANGTATLTVTATQNAINATLANATGLTYTPTANVNGADALTILTSDGGATGTGGAQTDSDNKTISVTAVNDAPVATGSTAAMTTILEDASSAGQTVSSVFGSLYSDTTDQVTGGSSADAFAGIVITSHTPNASGAWQYSTNGGVLWNPIATVASAATGFALAATTLIRFLPAANANSVNSTIPTFTATLVDNSGGALTTGTLNAATTGGTTRFSSGSVVLSQTVTAVNDAPTASALQGDSVTTTEPAGAGSVMSGVNIDSGANMTFADVDNANFSGGTLRFAITAGKDSTQDQLNIDTTGIVTIAAGTISVSGTAIGTVSGGGSGGGDIVITLNANATPALVQSVARFVFFGSTGGDNPTAGARTITTTLVDGSGTANGGVDTLTVTSTVNVVATNDTPTITGLPASLPNFTPGVEGNVDLSASTFGDVDSANLSVIVGSGAGGGTFATTAVAGITIGGTATTPTFSGTVAAINAYFDTPSNIRWTPSANFNGSNSINVTVSDGVAAIAGATIANVSFAPVSLATAGVALTQSFDALANTGATNELTIRGWALSEAGTSPNQLYGSGTGSSNAGDTYSFGSVAATDRALGGLQSGTVIPTIGAAFTNNTGLTLTSLLVSYFGEQWRNGGANAIDTLDFQISTNATSLTTGTWTDVNALDFNSPIVSAVAAALDGNLAANRTAVSSEITGLTLASGATIWIRWTDFNVAGSNAGLAIDDFSITARSLTAAADAGTVAENATITNGNLFANDASLGGAPALLIASAMSGATALMLGTPFTTASGGSLTVNANGTYSYNPNGAFNYLIDAATAAATGATNTSATETFTYTLTGASSALQTATVTVTINGVAGAGDQLRGGAGNDTINGTPLDDFFNLSQGGNDTVTGGAGNDAFMFGAAFTAFDSVDGGPGTNDQVGLQGDYSGGLTLGASSLVNVEVLAVLPGFSYNITSIDANVATGQELSVFGGNLLAGNNFTFNGSAETNGRFRMFGGLGTDSFTGGAQEDGFYFGPGKWGAGDSVTGGGGANDQLALDGDYSINIGANADVETLILLPGPGGTPNNFNITLTDVWTAALATKTVWGLNVTTAMTVNGSAETNGNLVFFGGQGSDTLIGGSGNDSLDGGTENAHRQRRIQCADRRGWQRHLPL